MYVPSCVLLVCFTPSFRNSPVLSKPLWDSLVFFPSVTVPLGQRCLTVYGAPFWTPDAPGYDKNHSGPSHTHPHSPVPHSLTNPRRRRRRPNQRPPDPLLLGMGDDMDGSAATSGACERRTRSSQRTSQ